jgi:hypothetical protein
VKIKVGAAPTVTEVETSLIQPLPDVKVYFMEAEPVPIAVTKPVEASTVATPVLSELHTPPNVAFDNCVVLPTQVVVLPVMGVKVNE